MIIIIKFNLDAILKDLNISRNHFSSCCGVRPNTVNDMCNGLTKRIEIDTLILILTCLNEMSGKEIGVGDLISYEYNTRGK